MRDRLSRLRESTDGFTVTPAQFERVADIALVALALIVLTGAAVRLTGSGLGCPDWPKCYGKAYPPISSHALIEFGNRVVTGPVGIAAVAAAVLAWRRRPYRRDLVVLGAMLPLGVAAQAVLGGFTVTGNLDYGFVMAHFALSMLILVAAIGLAWQARHEPGEGPRSSDRETVWAVRGLVALAGVTIFAGTAATAAGPHAGGSPGQHINRLSFDGTGTMDFAIHRHGELAALFGVAAIAVWWWLGRRPAGAPARSALTAVCLLLAAQGAVGLIQYGNHLPTELVWVHVALAVGTWLAVLWAALTMGRLVPRAGPDRASPEPGAAAPPDQGVAARERIPA